MLYRYMIESLSRKDEDGTIERLREIGLEGWEMVSVLPGTREDPTDPDHLTFFFKRDASTDIGL